MNYPTMVIREHDVDPGVLMTYSAPALIIPRVGEEIQLGANGKDATLWKVVSVTWKMEPLDLTVYIDVKEDKE